ncbi:hypothetical protein K8I61_08760 [bacterium]|nr:hypothetical protein [bacterium]
MLRFMKLFWTIVLAVGVFAFAHAEESKDCHTLMGTFEYDGSSHFDDTPTAFRHAGDTLAMAGWTAKNDAASDADGFVSLWRPFSKETKISTEWDGPAAGFDSFNDAWLDPTLPAGPFAAAGYSSNTGTGGDFTLVIFDEDGTPVKEDLFDAGASGEDCAFAVTRSGDALYAVGYGTPGGQAHVDWLVIKYDLSGNRLWERTYAGETAGHDVARKVAPDGEGGIIVGGETWGPTGPRLTGVQWNSGGNVVRSGVLQPPVGTTRTVVTNIVVVDETILIGGNYHGANDAFISSDAQTIDASRAAGSFNPDLSPGALEQTVLESFADGSVPTMDLATFAFNPPDVTAPAKGPDQETLVEAYDASGTSAWYGTWDPSDQGLLGVINTFDDNGDVLFAGGHTIDGDGTTRAALLYFDHTDWDQAKRTFVLPHFLEVSGKITDTQNTFDTTVFVQYTPDLSGIGDDDDDDADDDDAGDDDMDPIEYLAGAIRFKGPDSAFFDIQLFLLSLDCPPGDDDDDADDDDAVDDDDTADDDDANDDGNDDDDDDDKGDDDDDDDGCGGCGC